MNKKTGIIIGIIGAVLLIGLVAGGFIIANVMNDMNDEIKRLKNYKEKKEEVSEKFEINYVLMNEDKLDPRLSVVDVELSESEILVKGSEEDINSIAKVNAIIDVSNLDIVKAGTYYVADLKLVAYSDDGMVIEKVSFVTSSLDANLEVSSYSKKVPVSIIPTGELVSGKAIKSITINGVDFKDFEMTIYGDEESLKKIDSVPVSVDVSEQGYTGQKTWKVKVAKPDGVKGIEYEELTVVMNFIEAMQKTITVKNIKIENLYKDYKANFDGENISVEVKVIGAADLLNSLDESKLEAYVDLTGYMIGTYSTPVMIRNHDPRLVMVASKNVSVVIYKAK